MSSSRPAQSSTSSGRSRQSARIIAQTNIDAKLNAEFEESRDTFDYSRSVDAHKTSPLEQRRTEKVTAYLQHIQRGNLIQPFGCLLALDEKAFKVIAYSKNAPEMLTMVSYAVPSVGDQPTLGIGTDVRTLFTAPSTAALQKALGFADVSMLNPILVHCKTSGKPFYAIIHRVTACLIVDFEPVKPTELPMTAAGALQSYKLAAKAIAKLQLLPGGSMERLCNTVVEEVFELTGYDRVMTYKFHEDDHGEVIAEITKPGLDPYLGLHYPATDIPQAARFLFLKNKVRMICDCRAKPVKVYQDETLPIDISFCGSTLRAPHSCHLQYMENMNSIASLVMAVVVNEGGDEDETERGQQPQQQKRKKLWGLVVCHNESPRFVPFPLRYACEFLMQVFAIHVHKEFEFENQVREKNILRTQTLLCDMLLKEAAPLSIVSQSPNIMDLVKCEGAALLHQNKVWRLGLAPTESEIRDIAFWLAEYHPDSTGLSTDSLHDAGYPGALALGHVVCGMATARITSKDILFWFRSHTAAQIRWGGAKHDPAVQDDGKRMHPRSSFKAFLEVVKMRSLPWNDYEVDAIHSLQLILRGTLSDFADASKKEATLDSQINDLKLEGMVELQAVTNEMVRLIETATAPILAVDNNGVINGWNQKIAELTGLSVDEAIGKHLLSLVEEFSIPAVEKMLYFALRGKEEQNVQFQMKTHGRLKDDGPVILVVNACANRDIHDYVVGVCFVAQDMTGHKMVMDRFTRIEGDYKAIIQNPSPLIPPIFGADEFGWCSEWNAAMNKLSGWQRDEVMDKMLLGEVFGSRQACCRMKQDAFVNLSVIINNAMTGQETEKAPFGFLDRNGKHVECLLSVSKKVDGEGIVTGVFCFLHTASHELQHVLQVQQLSEQAALKRLKALAYIRHEIRNPLSGILYSRKMLEGTDLCEEQKQLLNTGTKCHHQLNKILDDLDLDNIMDSCLDLEMVEFCLQDVVVTAVSQVLIASQEKGIRITYDSSGGVMNEGVYGDSLRLQQILADFLFVTVKFSPSGGQVEITASLIKDSLGETLDLIHLELRIKHTGSGIPEDLLSQMFGSDEDPNEEGLGLLVCRKLLRLMNGDVCYLRESSKSSFIISLELASAMKPKGAQTFTHGATECIAAN
ncbi:phytochrome A type 3 [Typha latifolia]|uniref:phytochrome A type 3 n=1 Tax=Typha latifolia TaxID=4733 RepID=UPI003C2F5AD1